VIKNAAASKKSPSLRIKILLWNFESVADKAGVRLEEVRRERKGILWRVNLNAVPKLAEMLAGLPPM
jgi:hypothetical protein